MEITTLQAQINNGGTLPKIMTQNGEISNVRKQIADNTRACLKTKSCTKSTLMI